MVLSLTSFLHGDHTSKGGCTTWVVGPLRSFISGPGDVHPVLSYTVYVEALWALIPSREFLLYLVLPRLLGLCAPFPACCLITWVQTIYIYIFKYFQQLFGKLLCLKSMEQKGQKQRPVSMEYYSDIKKEWKNPICSNSMDCHTEWNKSDKDISLWNLKKHGVMNSFTKQK